MAKNKCCYKLTAFIFYYFFSFFLPLVNLISKYIKIANEANRSVKNIKSFPSKGIAIKAIATAIIKSCIVLYFKSSLKIIVLLFKKRIYKFIFIKDLQIFNTFTNSNILNWNLKLVRNSYNNTTFSCTI